MHRRKSRNNPLILFSDEINCTSISRLSFLFKTHVKTCWNQTVAACTLWIMLNSILKMKNNTPSLRAGNWSDLNQAAANPRQTVTRNGAWAVNQSSRGFTAQLSESWAYLSPYSAEQKKKNKTHTLVSSFPRSFFTLHILLLLPAPSLLWWMEGMNSPWPPGVSLWGPQQLNKQHTLKLKGAIRNFFWTMYDPGIFVYGPEALRKGTWKVDFSGDVITHNLDSPPLPAKSATLNKTFTSSFIKFQVMTFNEWRAIHTQINH